MRRICSILILPLITMMGLSAQSYVSKETTAYIEQYREIAVREMKLYHIPASITLAQGILESGSGRSDLARLANNHFGIKCGGDYSGKKYFKDDDKKNECFRVYKHAEESYRDHSLFLQKSRYADLFKLSPNDYKGWAKGLRKAGYATDPKYPDRLISVIEQNKLYEFDKQGKGGKQKVKKESAKKEDKKQSVKKSKKKDNKKSSKKKNGKKSNKKSKKNTAKKGKKH